MYLSPFSAIKRFYFPDGKGIYVTPWDNANPSGWGEPRKTPEGEPIIPGTPGGPLPHNYIDLKGDVINSTSFQRSGNITWIGDWVNPADHERGSIVLSYAGPSARYFADPKFRYGDSPDHNQIYQNGGVLCVAPGPVLGACLRTLGYTDPTTGLVSQVKHIIVSCLSGSGAVFYKKPVGGITRSIVLSDEYVATQKAIYSADKNPKGWVTMGTTSGSPGEYPHETPWFFNEAGTEAMCMRRKSLTFNNGGSDVTEDVCLRYVATLSETTVNAHSVANYNPMRYDERWNKVRGFFTYYDHTYDTDRNHQEDWLELTLNLEGKQEVMCDYVGNERVVGLMNCWVGRVLNQYSTYNYGPETNTYTPPGPFAPRDNPQYPIPWDASPPPYLPTQRSHYETLWVSETARFVLEVYVGALKTLTLALYSGESGTSDEYTGGTRKEWNPYLYYIRNEQRQVCGMADFRFNILHALTETEERIVRGSTFTNYKNESTIHTASNPKGRKLYTHTSTGPDVTEYGWPESTLRALTPTDFNTTITRTTYDGSWPADNATGAVRMPGSRTGYSGSAAEAWPTIWELLRGDSIGQILGNGVVNDKGEHALSIEVPDVASPGKYVLVSDSTYGSNLQTVIDHGARFYPVGTC